MAAYAALVSLMHIVNDIQTHHSPPISIHIEQAQSLSQIIASLLQFLEDRSSTVTETDEADPLERQIADAAYAAEDVIESHIVNRILPTDGSQHRGNEITKFFCCFRAIKTTENIPFTDDQTTLYEQLQRVIEEMESIEKLTAEINAGKAAVHDQQLNPADAPSAPTRSLTSTRQNSITVCSDDVINEVMDKLTSEETSRHVIPIVGMGGIGKTTLARNIYEKPLIKEHFDIRAWATVSQQYNTKEILCEILSKASNQDREELIKKSEEISKASNQDREELIKKSEEKLGTELRNYLFGRRYLIVMDDVWGIDALDGVQRFLPDNKNRSRVLVTTRLSQLGSILNSNYSHHMKFLDEDSSWDLFSKTVFGEESCPSEIEGIGKKIVENCRGLPLSIVVVGGILKKIDRSRRRWESIGKNLTSVLGNDKHRLRLLGLSYNHLPAHLKPCFLYMGVFEEDSEIKVSTLIKLWVCEGFLKPISDESLETIGKGFLKDLVDRNLILVHKLGATGNVKYCKIHDLLRDFSLSEGKKSGFYHVLGQDSPQGISKQRRVVIPRNTSKWKVRHDLKAMSHVRSVISEYGKVPSYQSFRLVRALHAYKFRYCDDESYVNSSAFQYVNLRHLAVEVDSASSLLSSIGLCWNLHTMIVSCKKDSTAPVEIWRMLQFRRIEFLNMRLFLPDPPGDAAVMENLQMLGEVENFKFSEEAVERLPNIKKLKLRYSGREGIEHEDYYSLSNIEKLRKLESLHVSLWIDFRRFESLNKLTFPLSLKKLTLSMTSKFEWSDDILGKIGSLPHLEKLKLWEGCFGTGEWEVAEGQFPCLRYLGIFSCFTLKKMTTQEGSEIFPRLQVLDLYYLEEMEEIPYEIGEIATLLMISIVGCSASVVKCAREILDEQVYQNGEDQVFQLICSGEIEELSPGHQVLRRYISFLAKQS